MRRRSTGLQRAATHWEIMEAETVGKHTSNYSLTKHTSHHQAKPLKLKIYPHLLPTSFAISHNRLLFWHPQGPLIGLIFLTELHLRSMWGIRYGSLPKLHPASFSLCPVTTINICNNKLPEKLQLNLRGPGEKSPPSAFGGLSFMWKTSSSWGMSLSFNRIVWLGKNTFNRFAPGNPINMPHKLFRLH